VQKINIPKGKQTCTGRHRSGDHQWEKQEADVTLVKNE